MNTKYPCHASHAHPCYTNVAVCRVLHAAHSDVFMQSRAHVCVLSDVLQCHAVWCKSVTRCVAVCCTRRIATYPCNPTHAHACYQRCSSVMQCDAVFCRSVMQCGGVCCTRRAAPYACNPTHALACYRKLPCHHSNPHVFLSFFLLECVCGCMCVRMCMYVCVGWVCGCGFRCVYGGRRGISRTCRMTLLAP